MNKRGNKVRNNVLLNKRSQVAIFVIIAVVIVAAIIVVYSFREEISIRLGLGFTDVQEYVDACVGESALDAIYFNSLQGGYYDVPEPKETYGFIEMPVYLNDGNLNAPSIEVIEQEIGKGIKENIVECVNNFEEFEGDYEFEISDVNSVDVEIRENDVNVVVSWPITVTQGEKSQALSKFTTNVDFDLLTKYNLVGEFIMEQQSDQDSILLSWLENHAEENELVVESFIIGDEEDYIYSFVFNETRDELNYVYSFVIKY